LATRPVTRSTGTGPAPSGSWAPGRVPRPPELELRELIDADLPADEVERLARVDALLRIAARRVQDPDPAPSLVPRARCHDGARRTGRCARERPGRVPAKRRSDTDNPPATADAHATPPAITGSTPHRADEQTHELKLSFGELALIYKSLQAAKALGALSPQDELLDDTIQLVDQALNTAI
jgi:hypothetical protein